MIDKYNREIDYARISLTSCCNLRCKYCSQHNEERENISLSFYKNLIDALDKMKIKKIRFTGGEPMLNPNIAKLVAYAKSKKNIKHIGITTNGVLINEYLEELVENGLNKINFSLDTMDRERYIELTGSDKLNVVIENIKKAKSYNLEVKINAVLLKGRTEKEFINFLDWGYKNNVQVRFIELMPIGENVKYYYENYLSSEKLISSIDCKITKKNNNEVATYYTYNDKYDFGIISPISSHFCNSCNRIRITSKGKLRLCLHSDDELDLVEYKGSSEKIYKILKDKIYFKPEKHFIKEKEFVKSNMVQIGG